MKISRIYSVVLALTSLLFIYCSKNDDSPEPIAENTPTEETPVEEPPIEETPQIDGSWSVSSTNLYDYDYAKYFIINTDNTLVILNENELGFKSLDNANYTNDEENSQITINYGYGSALANYTLTDDELVMNFPDGFINLIRSETADDNDWVEELTILEEGDAPWNEDVDIAWNGSQILVGNGYEVEDIGLVNPETFALEGTITTTRSAFAVEVEVEKYDSSGKYIFQSSNGHSKFFIYRESDNTYIDESLDLGAWIYGLASVDYNKIWAASGNERTLYLYNYSTVSIEQTIELGDTRPYGLDYQDGYLYVCAEGMLYKCDVTDGLTVVNSYVVPDVSIVGIAYDGSNFWIYGHRGDDGKLIKLDLSI
ncbi:YncE family protein [Maribacter thermophilus]|uniref:YncE family protein n=1 Tax=Maribacter thermophilus TaxID=1197874 RepID=UPI000A704D0F|nr:hypothetical protein [Maribacter thermophilus]